MAFSLLALLHPALVVYAQRHPLWADLSGGLKEVKDLQSQVEAIRENLFKISSIKSAVAADARLDLPQSPKVIGILKSKSCQYLPFYRPIQNLVSTLKRPTLIWASLIFLPKKSLQDLITCAILLIWRKLLLWLAWVRLDHGVTPAQGTLY